MSCTDVDPKLQHQNDDETRMRNTLLSSLNPIIIIITIIFLVLLFFVFLIVCCHICLEITDIVDVVSFAQVRTPVSILCYQKLAGNYQWKQCKQLCFFISVSINQLFVLCIQSRLRHSEQLSQQEWLLLALLKD